MISDREDMEVMRVFLEAVRIKSPETKINALMTDDGEYKRPAGRQLPDTHAYACGILCQCTAMTLY